mgnify:CR=1 FL=1
MYPTEDITNLCSYEAFGTHMSESLLLSLGYFSDEELETRRTKGLPPSRLHVGHEQHAPPLCAGGKRHRLYSNPPNRP